MNREQINNYIREYELKDKINKVVEFINDINDWEICSKYDCIYKDDILEILKKLNINKGE